jgi:hypothetical protein
MAILNCKGLCCRCVSCGNRSFSLLHVSVMNMVSISSQTLLSSLSNNNTGCKDLPCEQPCTCARARKLGTFPALANFTLCTSRTRKLNMVDGEFSTPVTTKLCRLSCHWTQVFFPGLGKFGDDIATWGSYAQHRQFFLSGRYEALYRAQGVRDWRSGPEKKRG